MVLILFVMLAGTATTLTVDSNGSGDYSSIQESVDNTVSSDAIIVNEGQYRGLGG